MENEFRQEEFDRYFEVEGEVFDTEAEALEYAHKVLGFDKEWMVFERYEKVIDVNYTNYN